ncbi:MAG: hypothetical protein IPJ77_23575 [Planctomycetes bacterium]|nr:hypothetical protein [Planctomycetota bacterium]
MAPRSSGSYLRRMIPNTHDELAWPRTIETRKSGVWLLDNPSTNQGTSFDRTQRDTLRVRGMLPTA